MITAERYEPETGALTPLPPGAVAAWRARPTGLLWVDLASPGDDELRWLAETFDFHPLAMEDVRNQQQRAKLDEYDGYYFVVLRAPDYHPRSHRMTSHQVDLFVGPHFLVSIHRTPIAALAQARHRWEQARAPHLTVAFLLYLLADSIVDSYFPVLDTIGDRIDEIDVDVFAHPDPSDLQEIFTLRRSLLSIRRILGPMRDAFNELIQAEESAVLLQFAHTRVFFSDVYDHILRLTDFADTYRDMLSGSMEAYQSAQANKLNQNMQWLTVAATVLATGTVLTGFFGMNLQGMGINSAWPYGGHAVLVVLVAVTLLEIIIFHRKGWL